jgi:Flp pilus assembly protein TadG
MAGARQISAALGSFKSAEPLPMSLQTRGQALVEFTLIFILLLILAWIPADFGLAFYTGQLAQNAAREGARIAAVDPDLPSQSGTCTLPCAGQSADSVLGATAARLSSALIPGAVITVTYPVGGTTTCNQLVRVQVAGSYNFFFYRLISLFGAPVDPVVNISRATEMRWEHQPGCVAR